MCISEGEPKISDDPGRHARHPARQGRLYAGSSCSWKAVAPRTSTIHFAGAFGTASTEIRGWCSNSSRIASSTRFRAAGNAAGAGAGIALFNPGDRRRSTDGAEKIEKIRPRWTEIKEHSSTPWRCRTRSTRSPKLSAAVKLPPRKTVSEDGIAGDAAPRRRSREGHAARRGRG